MLTGGLVSITFRQLFPAEIVKLVVEASLQAIEWGGDVHVPHGDINRAKEVYRMTADNGLRVAAYGSYYRVSESEADGLNFTAVLDTAQALNAPLIRVWAGKRGSDTADENYWQAVVDDSRRIVNLAAAANIQVAYEYHGNTLTDTLESVQTLMQRTANCGIGFYWQPPKDWGVKACLEGLQTVLPRLALLHVFQWQLINGSIERRPLIEGENAWLRYLSLAKEQAGNFAALIEFVQDDSPAQFLQDAKTLTHWLHKINLEN